VIICDKNKKPIELRKVIQEKNEDNYLYVKSEAKQKKEESIQNKLSERFEEGLKAIKESIEKKRGIKTIQKVYERIGRLKSKYPRVSNYFIIKTDYENELVKKISWTIKEPENDEKGIYFIRTNIKDPSEQTMWNIYNTIREIESTFRCLKTELCIRPNYHQKDENIEPHIHLGILAYQVVSAIRYQLKSMGMKDNWTTLLSKMNTQKVITTAMMKKDGEKVFVRNCTIPSSELLEIYQKLKLKPVPFYKKRCVPPTNQ
jgi:transposase